MEKWSQLSTKEKEEMEFINFTFDPPNSQQVTNQCSTNYWCYLHLQSQQNFNYNWVKFLYIDSEVVTKILLDDCVISIDNAYVTQSNSDNLFRQIYSILSVFKRT